MFDEAVETPTLTDQEILDCRMFSGEGAAVMLDRVQFGRAVAAVLNAKWRERLAERQCYWSLGLLRSAHTPDEWESFGRRDFLDKTSRACDALAEAGARIINFIGSGQDRSLEIVFKAPAGFVMASNLAHDGWSCMRLDRNHRG